MYSDKSGNHRGKRITHVNACTSRIDVGSVTFPCLQSQSMCPRFLRQCLELCLRSLWRSQYQCFPLAAY